ncbi:ATP-binding protein [Kitasatospora sp. NPDC059811]|uniref:sensor histidine kinase n=1 Tax=Streptomycetaceae TaxID=2062 RepID=UPI001FCB3F37|nr:HAMP domain-containing sensor histidine kinase [Streptomyces sp. MJM8645]
MLRRLLTPIRGLPTPPRPPRRPGLPRPLRRFVPRSVRARATAAAGTVLAAALALAGAGLLTALHADLVASAASATRQQAESVAQLAVQGRLTPVLHAGHGTDFLQAVDAHGTVLAASPNLAGRTALTAAHRTGSRTTDDVDPLYDHHRQRLTAVTADTPGGPVTVYAGASLRAADEALDTTQAALAVACPLLLLIGVVVTWRVTGHALRPVEAIRAEVDAITGRDLHRRVPEPGTADEIARLAATMNAMLDRLEASGRRQRQFIADASHELRSPLAVLRTQLEVADTHPDPAVRAELVHGALQDTDRLQSLATDLLLLARLDAGGAEDRPRQRIDLTGLVAATVLGRPAGPHRRTTDLAPAVAVEGIPLWLGRLLTNLLDNADRHAAGAVHVRLAADRARGVAVLDVEDDGPGIPPADRERVFERFTRLDDARSRDEGGSGLGLPIARDIARHHGGTLAVTPTPSGARLTATLPLAAVPPAPDPLAPAPGPAVAPASASRTPFDGHPPTVA